MINLMTSSKDLNHINTLERRNRKPYYKVSVNQTWTDKKKKLIMPILQQQQIDLIMHKL